MTSRDSENESLKESHPTSKPSTSTKIILTLSGIIAAIPSIAGYYAAWIYTQRLGIQGLPRSEITDLSIHFAFGLFSLFLTLNGPIILSHFLKTSFNFTHNTKNCNGSLTKCLWAGHLQKTINFFPSIPTFLYCFSISFLLFDNWIAAIAVSVVTTIATIFILSKSHNWLALLFTLLITFFLQATISSQTPQGMVAAAAIISGSASGDVSTVVLKQDACHWATKFLGEDDPISDSDCKSETKLFRLCVSLSGSQFIYFTQVEKGRSCRDVASEDRHITGILVPREAVAAILSSR